MGIAFSGSEILEIAIGIEENGIKFYQGLMSTTTRPELKGVYEFLVREEKAHRQTFSGMLESAGKSWTVESYPGEESAYVNALAESALFTPLKANQAARCATSDVEALNQALQMEKDSVLFYTAMRDMVRADDRKTVDGIIAQEKAHIVTLSAQQKSLLKPEAGAHGKQR